MACEKNEKRSARCIIIKHICLNTISLGLYLYLCAFSFVCIVVCLCVSVKTARKIISRNIRRKTYENWKYIKTAVGFSFFFPPILLYRRTMDFCGLKQNKRKIKREKTAVEWQMCLLAILPYTYTLFAIMLSFHLYLFRMVERNQHRIQCIIETLYWIHTIFMV